MGHCSTGGPTGVARGVAAICTTGGAVDCKDAHETSTLGLRADRERVCKVLSLKCRVLLLLPRACCGLLLRCCLLCLLSCWLLWLLWLLLCWLLLLLRLLL